MELTRRMGNSTNELSNNPAQMHARHPVFGVLPSSSAVPSPFPCEQAPIDLRRRVFFIFQHLEMTTD